jgi:multicomponent Na+:H+ antiporter subunit E
MSAGETAPSSAAIWRSALLRALGFSSLWLILSGADSGGLLAGTVAVGAATWTSLKLLPAAERHFSPAGAVRFVLRFLLQSAIAGTDVARRALDPRLPLRPGFVNYPVQLPPGAARNTFCTLSSLLPGTLPAGPTQGDGLLIHCLDVGEPIVTQLTREETLLMRATGTERGHG